MGCILDPAEGYIKPWVVSRNELRIEESRRNGWKSFMGILNTEELIGCVANSINHRVDEEEYLTFLRFTDRQMQVYEPNAQFHQMSLCSSGANPSYEKIKEQITLFFVRWYQLYPNVPTYVLTPIWRADMNDTQTSGTFASITQLILDIAGVYPSVQLVDGIKISPHNTTFYADGSLHPNISGFSYMAPRLFKAIKDSFPTTCPPNILT